MSWERTKGGWILERQVAKPDAEEDLVWYDNHIKLWLSISGGTALYHLHVDQRRCYQEVVDPHWVALFFGYNPRIRGGIKGKRLWRDRQVVLQRYGRKPRTYFVVSRKV